MGKGFGIIRQLLHGNGSGVLRIEYKMRRLEATSMNNFKVYINDWFYKALDILLQVLLDVNSCVLHILFKLMINKSGGPLGCC